VQGLAKGIDRAGPDVAIDDTEGTEHQDTGTRRGVHLSRVADRFLVAIGWCLDHQRYSDKAGAALHDLPVLGKCCIAIAAFRRMRN
jgi:hypothetical protein